jgi:hypothetical protein
MEIQMFEQAVKKKTDTVTYICMPPDSQLTGN